MEKLACPVSQSASVKNGIQSNCNQRYICKTCRKSFQATYENRACQAHIDQALIVYLKEGIGIRSISRILKISTTTVLKRIKQITQQIEKPPISMLKEYEMDELSTYIQKKNSRIWVSYAIRKDTR